MNRWCRTCGKPGWIATAGYVYWCDEHAPKPPTLAFDIRWLDAPDPRESKG